MMDSFKINTVQGFLNFIMDNYPEIYKNEVKLLYEGEITHDITMALTSLAESKMEKEEEKGKVQRKVYHVMVECLQNINKHAGDQENAERSEIGKGFFLISKGGDFYSVCTANIIESKNVDDLKSKLEYYNTLSKDELKQLYKEQIRGGSLSEVGGAGLGFIDIIRKTGQKLLFHFVEMDADYSFFILVSQVER